MKSVHTRTLAVDQTISNAAQVNNYYEFRKTDLSRPIALLENTKRFIEIVQSEINRTFIGAYI